MADTETLATETTNQNQEAPKAGRRGAVQRVEMNVEEAAPLIESNGMAATKGAEPETTIEPNKTGNEGQEIATSTEFTDVQRKALLKEIFGDEEIDIEAIKEKIKPTKAEPTEEQKKKAATDKELRLLNLFVSKFNGTPEMYNLQKQIANADPKEFSKAEVIGEAIAAGFTEDEAKVIANERYYQIQLDGLEQDYTNDESDEDFEKRKAAIQKKIDFGSKKLEAKSSYKIQQAKEFLGTLQKEADSEDLQRQEDEQISSNVDEVLKTMPRKQTLELGKSNDIEINPIQHEVAEESIEKVKSILKDPQQRNNLFNNQDGTLNLSKLTDVLLKAEEYNRLAKYALLEGQDRQTKIFQKTFPATSPQGLGIGGVPDKSNGNGNVQSRGKRQVVQPTHN